MPSQHLDHATLRHDDSGIALLIVMAALMLVVGLATVLVLTSLVEIRIAAASRDGRLARSSAEAGLVRTLIELRSSDWNSVLGGAISTFSDGAPTGTRPAPDGSQISLDDETADMQCGKQGGCSDADISTVSTERPWGSRNPRWRLYGYGPLGLLTPGDPSPPRVYLAVWVADDPADADNDPSADSADDADPGKNVVMVAVRAFGVSGIRRTVEVVVERVGTDLRILAWHERHP